ncbi:hypothetical protein ABTE17_22270, partial [Acinetobacter baumannii]
LAEALQSLGEGRAEHAIVLENDLSRRTPGAILATALTTARTVCALDHLESPTTIGADLAIPVASLAESDGVFVNAEGR